jgi:hypothetical protein
LSEVYLIHTSLLKCTHILERADTNIFTDTLLFPVSISVVSTERLNTNIVCYPLYRRGTNPVNNIESICQGIGYKATEDRC